MTATRSPASIAHSAASLASAVRPYARPFSAAWPCGRPRPPPSRAPDRSSQIPHGGQRRVRPWVRLAAPSAGSCCSARVTANSRIPPPSPQMMDTAPHVDQATSSLPGLGVHPAPTGSPHRSSPCRPDVGAPQRGRTVSRRLSARLCPPPAAAGPRGCVRRVRRSARVLSHARSPSSSSSHRRRPASLPDSARRRQPPAQLPRARARGGAGDPAWGPSEVPPPPPSRTAVFGT